MLTHYSLLAAIKHRAAYGEGQHFFDGRHEPRPQKREERAYVKPVQKRPPLRVCQDRNGRILTRNIRTNECYYLAIIR